MTCDFCGDNGVKTAFGNAPGTGDFEEIIPCMQCRPYEHDRWRQALNRRMHTFRETGVLPPARVEP